MKKKKEERTIKTSARLKLEPYEILTKIMREKGYNRTEAIEYCIEVYDEFLQDKERYTTEVLKRSVERRKKIKVLKSLAGKRKPKKV